MKEPEESRELEVLIRIQDKLEAMNSGKLKTALGMIDAAAKVSTLDVFKNPNWEIDRDWLDSSLRWEFLGNNIVAPRGKSHDKRYGTLSILCWCINQAYEKKGKIDLGVINLFASMDYVLSFVESVDKLKDKDEQFFDFIEESLRVIEKCALFILKYFSGNPKGIINPNSNALSTKLRVP